MLATYHQNSVSAVFSLKYSCWELKGWGLFTCKPSPPQVTTARQLIREAPSLMMDASSSRLDPKHISPKNHPETMVQNGTNIDGNWKCSGQQDVIPTCPPSGMVTAATAVTAALQPKDLVEAVHPSTWKHPAHTSVFISFLLWVAEEFGHFRAAKSQGIGSGASPTTMKDWIYDGHPQSVHLL